MTPFIPDDQLQFAQLAVKQKYIQPEQVRSALELYRRYQASSSDVPTIARILVGKGWLDRQKGEMLLRHLHRGEALPSTPAPAPAPSPVWTSACNSGATAALARGRQRRFRIGRCRL